MRNISTITLILGLFLIPTIGLHADCGIRKLPLNGATVFAYSNQISEDDEHFTVFEVLVKETDIHMKIHLQNLSLSVGSQIKTYNSNPCSGQPQLRQSFTISEFQNSFDISSNPTGSLFIKVVNGIDQSGTFRIKIQARTNAINDCEMNDNIYNSIDNPTIIERTEMQNFICLNSCNYYTRKYAPNQRSKYYPTKWFELSTLNKAFIDILFSDYEEGKDRILIYGIYADKKALIFSHESEEIINKEYLSVYRFSKILIGISTNKSQGSNFNLCLNLYDKKETCVDYFGGGDSLYVVSTSLGSSFEGPFYPGERVKFCYKILDWAPINFNYLHALIPSYGLGWDETYVDSITAEPFSYLKYIDNGFMDKTEDTDTMKLQQWRDRDTSFVVGMDAGDFAGKGWYFMDKVNGPKGNTQKFRWSRKFNKVRGSFEEPLFEFYFTLKTKDQCEGMMDCSVGIQPYSDNITGRYLNSGCWDNRKQEFISQLDCCDDEPLLTIIDDEACNGDFVKYHIDSKYSFHWESKYLEIEEGISNTVDQIAINDTDSTLISHIMFISMDERTCTDTLFAKLIVHPTPQFEVPDEILYCKNQAIHIEATPINPNHKYTYNWESEHQRGSSHTGNQYEFVPNGNNRKLLVTAKNAQQCVDSLEVALRKKDEDLCTSIDELLQCSVIPNPTLDKFGLEIINLTDDPNLHCSIFTKEEKLIYKTEILSKINEKLFFPIELFGVTSGTYSIILNNTKAAIFKKLIIIND